MRSFIDEADRIKNLKPVAKQLDQRMTDTDLIEWLAQLLLNKLLKCCCASAVTACHLPADVWQLYHKQQILSLSARVPFSLCEIAT